MDVNSLFVGTGARMFERHPNGDFDATVMDVVMQKVEGKKPFMKIVLATSFGPAPDFRYFPVTPNDAHEASFSPEARKKIMNRVEFHKGVMIKLGLSDEMTVASWTQEKIIAAYASLKGKRVRIKVEDDPMNTSYSRSSLVGMAAPTAEDHARAVSSASPAAQAQAYDHGFGMPADGERARPEPLKPQERPQYQNYRFPNPHGDDIPF